MKINTLSENAEFANLLIPGIGILKNVAVSDLTASIDGGGPNNKLRKDLEGTFDPEATLDLIFEEGDLVQTTGIVICKFII